MKSTKFMTIIMLPIIIIFFGTAFPVQASSADELSLSIEYPSEIKCGEAVTFTMNADGGSGNYVYRIAALMTYEGSELVNVYDISYGSNGAYKEDNEFTFTFYASGTYYIRFSVMDMTTYQTKMTGLFEYPIVIQDEDYPSVEQIITTLTTQCEAECSTDYEKALWLHDWIIDHADYDYSYSYCSAEGVLARGLGTCESYHSAYVLLLNKVGIETGRITGNGHVWTAVKMDDEWYHIDSTWDDMGADYKDTYYEHMYFGLNDYIIGLVHTDHTEAVAGYESTALENNYFIKSGEITQWSDSFVETIRQNLSNGMTEFVLPVSTSMPDNYKNVIYNLVAYQLSKMDWNNSAMSVVYADNQLNCKVVETETDTEEEQGQTIYAGVDYSTVYDYNYYINTYVDIKNAYGSDDEAVLRHFVNAGMSEGRQGNADFNVYTYKNNYIDLRRAFGADLKRYYMHYIYSGKAEGRVANKAQQFVGETIYNGVDYASVYNYDYYVNKYPDLKQAYGGNENALLQHFVEYGMAEGRVGNATFSVRAYRNRYVDLQNAFGSDTKRYYMHYLNTGKAEGRNGAPYNAADYAAVYDYDTYVAMNGGLGAAFGYDPEKLLEHFIEHGMSEGRQASAEFNVYAYRSRYVDLRNAFGDDLVRYYMHYIKAGRTEGRIATWNEPTAAALLTNLDEEKPMTEKTVEQEPAELEKEPETESTETPEVETAVESTENIYTNMEEVDICVSTEQT